MSPQASWILQEEVVPRLRSSIPRAVRCVGAEDAEELIQDATLIAARMIIRAESLGKLGKITPGNFAYYTLQHCKAGRRSTGSSVVDVMASRTQLKGTTALLSLNEVAAEDEGGADTFDLQDMIADGHEDPATIAARNLDWDSFLDQLSRIEKLVVEFLCAGRTLRDVSRKVGVSDSTMQTYRRKIAGKILEFMGTDVLADIVRLPGWRIGLDCEREAQACRNDRRACAAAT
jgi:DNA-binding NarL/FixJ family response regulator